jgi:hypothetical protein
LQGGVDKGRQGAGGEPWLPTGGLALRRAVEELSGTSLLKAILELPNARQVVEEMAPTDLFWIVKKIGEEDSSQLLEMASTEQWQHLVDLEGWSRDRVHLDAVRAWLKRLQAADAERLALWLLQEGDLLARFFLGRLLDVTLRDHDTDEVPAGFFSLDGVYYLRVRDPEQQEWIQELLADMARLDYGGYQRFLLGLAEYLPSEAEEELYRLRNARLSEQGFLPWEEAQAVYCALRPEAVLDGAPEVPPALELGDEERDLVPMIPLDQGDVGGLLARILGRIQDPIFLDRIRMEFAGLANQILSAEGVPVTELEVMGQACRRAASYLNLGLERLSLGELRRAEELVASRALISIFRVGYGLALRLQAEARAWVEGSWFRKMGLEPEFWGERWGSCLRGLLRRRPAYFPGGQEAEQYRDFRHMGELEETSRTLERLKSMDGLLERLMERYPMDPGFLAHPEASFHPLLFNLWGRWVLGKDLQILPMRMEEAAQLLRVLRGRDRKPPYRMPGFERRFVGFFLEHSPEGDREILGQALLIAWGEFRDEYERLPVEELDARFARLIRLEG